MFRLVYIKKKKEPRIRKYNEQARAQWSKATNKRRRNLKSKAVALLGGRCKICDYNKYDGALEFHHIDPSQKLFGLTAANLARLPWSEIELELAKCVLLCSNCHKEVEAGIIKI